MTRLLRALLAALLGLLLSFVTPSSTLAEPLPPSAAYTYDATGASPESPHHTTERGPPAAYDLAATYDAVDHRSHGASPRPSESTTSAAYTDDHVALLSQTTGNGPAGTERVGGAGTAGVVVRQFGVAAKSAEDFVGPLSKAEYDGLQKSLEPNKLNHLFAKQEHGLDGLVSRYGSQEAVVEQMYRGLSGAVSPGSDGLFSVTRTIGGEAVTIDGRVVNGIPRIGTAYIKP